MDSNERDQQREEVARWLALLREKPELEVVVASLIDTPDAIGVLLDIIRQDPGSVKFFCEKAIRTLSETHPDLVYPWFEDIAGLIHSSNHFIQWGALRTIANLVSVDRGRKFGTIRDEYLDLIEDETMITAATVVGLAGKLVRALPDLEPELTGRLLKAAGNTCRHKGQPSPECRDILIGHVLVSFAEYSDISTRQEDMLAFAEGQTENPRPSTASKAIHFIKKCAAKSK